MTSSDPQRFVRARAFATTQWSVVVAAGGASNEQARAATALLCARYWYPLYTYVRRRGHDADEAADLTQEFFATLLEKNYLGQVDRDRGRFRSFLLAALKHFLANEYDRARALKRGGGRSPISIDAESAEGRYRLEPSHSLTPERVYERRWALTVLDRVLDRMQGEFADAGQGERFDRLKGYLTGDAAAYEELAAALGTSEGAAKVAVHRLRKRYRELLRTEIADTVADAADVDAEVRELLLALGG